MEWKGRCGVWIWDSPLGVVSLCASQYGKINADSCQRYHDENTKEEDLFHPEDIAHFKEHDEEEDEQDRIAAMDKLSIVERNIPQKFLRSWMLKYCLYDHHKVGLVWDIEVKGIFPGAFKRRRQARSLQISVRNYRLFAKEAQYVHQRHNAKHRGRMF